MSVHYFKCLTCDQMFCGGDNFTPEKITCPIVTCRIEEISKEDADDLVEEMRNE